MRVPQGVSRSVSSNAASVEVMPLPAGKPVSFMGGVGNFTLSSSISSTHVKANEAIDTYDPKVDVSVKATAGGVSGTRTVEYTTIPRFAGKFKIPAVEFSYFDTKSKQYKTLHTEEYEITVEKGASGEGGM